MPKVEIVYRLAQQFMNLVRQHQSDQLDSWLEACAQSGIGNLQTFAEGIRPDYAAEPLFRGRVKKTSSEKMLFRHNYFR